MHRVLARITLVCLILLVVSACDHVNAQKVHLSFKDKVTNQPVEFANITVKVISEKILENTISDHEGKATMEHKLPVVISVSSLGFKTYIDTIKTPGEHVILLSPEFYQLDRVIVTGQFRAQPVDKSIYKIEVLDSKQIHLKAATNLGDLLRNELNFQYRSEGIFGDFLSIQGLSGEYIKILIDGIPVTGRVAGKIDLGQLTLCNIDHVEVIEGPMSVVYGSNALAGAINIVTADHSEQNIIGNANAYYESVGKYNLDIAASKRIGKSIFSLHGARNFHAGWGPVDTSRYKIWKPKLQYLAGGSYTYTYNELKIRYITDYMNEELRDPGELTIENLYESALDAYHFTTRWNNSLSIVNTFNDDFILNFQGGYSYYKKRKLTYVNDLVNLDKTLSENSDLHDTIQFHMISARVFVSNIAGHKFEYQTGVDINDESATGKRIRGNKNIADIAGFMNFIYKPLDVFYIQPGIRFIYNSKFKAPLVYAINLKYQPYRFTFRGSFSRGFRPPSLKQLYLEFIDSNHEILGNEDLNSETGYNIKLSGEYSHSKGKQNFDISLDLFYNSIQNAIQLAVDTSVPGVGSGKYFNLESEDFITQGFKFILKYYLFPRFTVQSGFIITGRSKLGVNREFVYSTDITAAMQYFSPKYNYEIGVFYKYCDNYLEFTGNFNEEGELSGMAQRSIQGYHIMDLTVSKTFRNQGITISAGIKNLFNVTLVDSSGSLFFHDSGSNSTAIGYGRTLFIGLQYTFEKL
ncbi:MAG: TonB-dependent receptor plug domain-containing protein [Bacteroidales bacterium]|nr:TonB-dependent receptor plug domain-containing protein [Bacteroidales bacterium]